MKLFLWKKYIDKYLVRSPKRNLSHLSTLRLRRQLA